MWIENDEFIIRCECGDLSHPVHLVFWAERYPETEEIFKRKFIDLDIYLEIENVGFWKRIKNSFLYIWKQRKFWHYGEINLNLLSEKGQGEVIGLIEFLQKKLKEAKEIEVQYQAKEKSNK